MRTQNLISATVFGLLLAAYASMHLLNWFPASEALWYINITFAREARPLFDLIDYATSANSLYAITGLVTVLGLCWMAISRKHRILTAVNTHLALFCIVFASIASYGSSMGTQISANISVFEVLRATSTLQPIEQAMAAMVVILAATCVCSHFGIMKELASDLFGKLRRT